MTTITERMIEVAAVAFFGKAGAAAMDSDERDGLRAVLQATCPLIENARLTGFASELMTHRDKVTCADPLDLGVAGHFQGHKHGLRQAADLARAAANSESGS